MSTANTEDTHPISLEPETNSKKRHWPVIVAGVLLVLICGGFGSWAGYRTAMKARNAQATSEVAMAAATQYNLAVADQSAGRLEVARQRLEYVIQLNPQFPGAVTKLSEVMFALSLSQTPTVIPTQAPTPTPDTRGIDEVYSQAQQYLVNKDWNDTINNLEIVRKDDIKYKAVQVDGMMYIALRNRGFDKITKEGSLEPGIYDLTLAERFGPIDGQADGYRNWARLYIIGASFWDLDWPQVIDYFSQIYPSVPNLRDKSGLTALERYRQALVSYGDQLGNGNEWCKAVDQYKSALAVSANAAVDTKLKDAQNNCSNPTSPAPSETPKPTWTGVATTPSTVIVTTEHPTATTPPPTATTPPPAATNTPVTPASTEAPVATTPPPSGG